ncbi:hypothetical protein NV377_14715 [Paenibacillus sp. T3-5-0-4]|nr:hypothetical protein [Paenibacillus endoradicis]
MTVLASGSVGFIVGFITEWLTAILPISIANYAWYCMHSKSIRLYDVSESPT